VGTDFDDYDDLNVSQANRVSSADTGDPTKKPKYDYLYYYYLKMFTLKMKSKIHII
jgi:hypothetical protein